MILRTDVDRELYEKIRRLWVLTDIERPERGDVWEVALETLKKGGAILSLWEGDDVLGALWITDDGRRLYLHHMAVHPDHRRKGLGRRLLKEGLAMARRLGRQPKLEVHETNLGARELYSGEGFTDLEGYVVMINRRP